MSVIDWPYTVLHAWQRAEAIRNAKERRDVQRIGRYDVLELADPPRNPDGTRTLDDLPPKDAA